MGVVDFEIGSKEADMWNEVKEKTEKDIEGLEKLLWFNKKILDLANENLNILADRGEIISGKI